MTATRRRIMSEGVKKLNLPRPLLERLEQEIRCERAHGPGHFLYRLMTVVLEDGVKEIVVSRFVKKLNIGGGITARPGDVGFTLRSEWNESTNPLD